MLQCVLQCVAVCVAPSLRQQHRQVGCRKTRCTTLQRTLQRTLQHTSTYTAMQYKHPCHTLRQDVGKHNVCRHGISRSRDPSEGGGWGGSNAVVHGGGGRHTATHCNTLQRSATLCNTLHCGRGGVCYVAVCVAACCSWGTRRSSAQVGDRH